MKIKIVTDTDTLLDEEMETNLSKENEAKLTAYDNNEVVSLLVEFKEGLKCKDIHDLSSVQPEDIKQLTIKVKP